MILIDKSVKPTTKIVKDLLGKSFAYWEEIRTSLESEYGPLTEEWKYYSSSSGWTMKLLLKKRNLFFLTPCKNHFRLAFIFGDKAVKTIQSSNLPKKLIKELNTARRYVEGRGLRVTVKKRADVNNVLTLSAIKIAS